MQLPTYDGTKSYQNLLVGVYGMESTGTTVKLRYDTELQQNPLDFIRSGSYSYISGNINARDSSGYYWESRAGSITNTWRMRFDSIYFGAQYLNYGDKGNGLSVRCLVR